MFRWSRLATGLLCSFLVVQSTSTQAQWGYPGGFDGHVWGGWGVGTAEGDIARGMGAFAMGAGFYNKQTAVANSIDTDTVMRWNEYLYQSQRSANRRRAERRVQNREANIRAHEEIQKRLRDNPEPADINRGSALNVALDEINNPLVYVKALKAANVKIGGDTIRVIPFQYSAAAITMSIHQLATGTLPAPLRRPEFEADREALKTLDAQIIQQIEDDKEPDAETVKKLLAAIYAAEDKAAKLFPKNSLDAKQAEKYLKALHGLVAMLKAPKVDDFLEGVEKRPEATLGELISFMTAFNLRFGPATTPQQRAAYSLIYPKLVEVRKQMAPALAAATAPKLTGTEAEDFYSGVSLDDIRKKAPKP